MSITAQTLSDGFKKHPFAFVAGFLAVALGVISFNRSASAGESEEALDVLTRQGTQILNNLTASTLLDDQLAELQSIIADIDKRLIRPSELALNLQYFYQLEAETGTLLVDLRPLNLPPVVTGPNAPAYIHVPFSVGVQGRFEQLVKFLRMLERGPHFVRITGVNLAPTHAINAEVLTMMLTLQLLGKS